MADLEFKDDDLRKIGVIESKKRLIKDTFFRDSQFADSHTPTPNVPSHEKRLKSAHKRAPSTAMTNYLNSSMI